MTDGLRTGVREIAATYLRAAEQLERSAAAAEAHAARCRSTGRTDEEIAQRERAHRAREAASRARAQAELLQSASPGAEEPALTPRELDVLVFASHGLTTNEIAEQLYVSRGTIRTHFENIYLKLGVGDKAAAVAFALRHGLIN